MASSNDAALLSDESPMSTPRCLGGKQRPRPVSISVASASTSGSTREGTGSDEKSSSSPATTRSTESAPLAKTPDFASPFQAEDAAEVPSGSLRRHSGGRRSPETRRCLVKQLTEAEVFNMANDSADESELMVNLLTAMPSCETLTPEDPEKSTRDDTTRSPCFFSFGASIPLGTLRLNDDSSPHGDAWVEDDWLSCPPSARSQTSPLIAASALDKMHQQVAEAVLSELQLDMQSHVQRAVNEMSSWISAEITFARRGFEEDARKACGSWAAKQVDLQSSHAELSTRIEQLQASLDEHVETTHQCDQDGGNQARPRAVTEPRPSASVMEARQLAEERKWRLKLDELQSWTERLQTLETQSINFTERAAMQDATIEESTSTVRKLQAQVGQCCKRVETLAKEKQDNGAARICDLEKMLDRKARDLAEKIAAHGASIGNSTSHIHDLEERLDHGAKLLAEEMAGHGTTIQGSATRISDLERMLNAEVVAIKETMAVQDGTVKDSAAQISGLERRFNNEVIAFNERIDAHDTIGKDSAAEILNLKERLAEEAQELAKTIAVHGASIGKSASHIHDLEERLDHDAKLLAEEMAEHATTIQGNATQISGLERRLNNEVGAFKQSMAVHDTIVKASTTQIHDLEEKLANEIRELAGKSGLVDGASIEKSVSRIQDLEVKLHNGARLFSKSLVAHDARLKESAAQIHGLDEKLDSTRTEFSERIGVHETKLKDTVTQMHDLERRLVDEAGELASTIAAQDVGIQASTTHVRDLAEKVENDIKALAEKIVAQATHAKGSTDQIRDLEEKLLNETTLFAQKTTVFDSSIEKCSAMVHVLDLRLGNETEKMADLVAANVTRVNDDCACQIHSLQEAFGSEAKDLTEIAAAHDVHIKELAGQMKNLERECHCIKSDFQEDIATLQEFRVQLACHESSVERNGDVLQDAIAQLSQHKISLQANMDALSEAKAQYSMAHKESIAERLSVSCKLKQHEGKLMSLRSHSQGELKSVKEGLVRAMGDLGRDLATELKTQLDTKASLSQMHQTHTAMQTWVHEAKLSHQTLIDELAGSSKQAAASSSEQDKTLQSHGNWMKEVSEWLTEAQERQQGLSNILYRIVEEDYSELTPLFQEAIKSSH